MVSSARMVGVGTFVLTAVLLFAIALFMIGDRQMAFAQKFVVYTEFTRITGLQPGGIIRVSGARAGSIRAIETPVDPNGKFRIRLEITEDLHQLVRTDSVAAIETEGLVGGAFLAISTGSAAAPQAPEESTIPSREPFLIADLFQQMSDTIRTVNVTVKELSTGIEEVLVSVDTTVGSANTLIAEVSDDVKTMTSAGARISADAAEIAEGIRRGEGTIGRLVKDDELYRRSTSIASSAEAIAADTRQAIQQARQVLNNLHSSDGQVAAVTASLKQTLEDARAAMAGLSENMEALKRNFLFRGFFNRRGYFDLADISPAEYRKGALTNGDRRPLRVWLRHDLLFEPPNGGENAQRLTDDGKARLDAALASNLSRLVDGVLMVEGYAQDGSVAERYVVSRERAALVRDYLVAKFHLDPRTVGLMPLGSDSIDSPQGSRWSGVALAVFIDN
jgi:phospholipid/cholesterol/gamma-HCH transport system substrate-binding protein